MAMMRNKPSVNAPMATAKGSQILVTMSRPDTGGAISVVT